MGASNLSDLGIIYSAIAPQRRIGTPHRAALLYLRIAGRRNAAHRSAGRNLPVVVRRWEIGHIFTDLVWFG